MKLMVTGASGLLGKKIMCDVKEQFEVVGSYNSRQRHNLIKLDLSDTYQIKTVLDKERPDIIIHTAAITDLNECERNPRNAKIINADATIKLAKWCNNNDSKLMYISTDYVFDGNHSPYLESSEPYPVQIYGFTKMLGEKMLEIHDGVVIRVGILDGLNDMDDKETVTVKIINALNDNEQIELDDLRTKYPTLIDDVSKAVIKMIDEKLLGIYHVIGEEGLTRYDWGRRVADILDLDKSLLIRENNKEKVTHPIRPKHIKLLNSKLDFRMSSLDNSILKILDQCQKVYLK